MTLRKHQAEFNTVIDGIIQGSQVRDILLSVTPGGGKSTIPIMAGRLIDAGLADAICWVVPRQALQDQGERGFLDPFFRDLLGHNITIRSATNDVNPCRGTQGYVTTYQALGVDTTGINIQEFKQRRYILLLDEYHHVEKDGTWHQALAQLHKRAKYRVLMTGTLERGDGKAIAFTNYQGDRPVLNNTESMAVVRYGRQDALEEQAILPISFHLSDGHVEWDNQRGARRQAKSFSETLPSERAAALYTALNTEFAAELLRGAVLHWKIIRKSNPRAKLLVVTADYQGAKDVTGMLKRAMGINAEIATSHKAKEAAAAIKRFKGPALDVLVTIAMAYEGLDVPPVTHICCMTHIRSTPWIEQMVARAVRIDKSAGPYDSQRAHVFAPRDPRFIEIVKRIEKEQVAALKQQPAETDHGLGVAKIPGEGGQGQSGPDITPIGSGMTGTSEHFIGIDPQQDIFRARPMNIECETVKEREIRLRQEISKHVNRFAFEHRYKPQRINSELKIKMGAPRELLELKALEFLAQYVKDTYPLGGVEPLKEPPPGVSLGRAKRKRVPTKAVPWKGVESDHKHFLMDKRQVFEQYSMF